MMPPAAASRSGRGARSQAPHPWPGLAAQRAPGDGCNRPSKRESTAAGGRAANACVRGHIWDRCSWRSDLRCGAGPFPRSPSIIARYRVAVNTLFRGPAGATGLPAPVAYAAPLPAHPCVVTGVALAVIDLARLATVLAASGFPFAAPPALLLGLFHDRTIARDASVHCTEVCQNKHMHACSPTAPTCTVFWCVQMAH